MSKVLFINGPSSGHIHPTLGLVEELVAKGEEVVYFSSEEFRGGVERTGATFRAYDNFLREDDPFQTNHFLALVVKLLSSYKIVIPSVMEQIKGEKFDYIIHDSMYGCGTPIAEILKLPHISTCTSFINAHKNKTVIGNLSFNEAYQRKEHLSNLRIYGQLSKEVSLAYGIKRPSMEQVFFNSGQVNIVFTSRLIQPDSDLLDESYKFVGVSLSGREEELDFPLELLKNKVVIYISMGTMFNDVRDFYDMCFKAFESFQGQVVLSVGNKINIDSFHDVPANFIVRKHVSQLTVLKYASLFITHGGMNSTNEALYYSVPLLVIPMAADQPIVADRLVTLGAGICLTRENVTPSSLRKAAEHIIVDDTYRQKSKKLGHTLRNAKGQMNAVNEVWKFKLKFKVPNGKEIIE